MKHFKCSIGWFYIFLVWTLHASSRLSCVSLPKSYSLLELVMERTISVLIYRVWPFTVPLVYDFGSIATYSYHKLGMKAGSFFPLSFPCPTETLTACYRSSNLTIGLSCIACWLLCNRGRFLFLLFPHGFLF